MIIGLREAMIGASVLCSCVASGQRTEPCRRARQLAIDHERIRARHIACLVAFSRPFVTWNRFAVEENVAVVYRRFLRSEVHFETTVANRIYLVGNVTTHMIHTDFEIAFTSPRCINYANERTKDS